MWGFTPFSYLNSWSVVFFFFFFCGKVFFKSRWVQHERDSMETATILAIYKAVSSKICESIAKNVNNTFHEGFINEFPLQKHSFSFPKHCMSQQVSTSEVCDLQRHRSSMPKTITTHHMKTWPKSINFKCRNLQRHKLSSLFGLHQHAFFTRSQNNQQRDLATST